MNIDYILFLFKHKITSDKPAGRLKARPGLCAEDHEDVKEYMTFLRRSLISY